MSRVATRRRRVRPRKMLRPPPAIRRRPMPSDGNSVETACCFFPASASCFYGCDHGELVVVTDDDDREGEGDLIVAASLCTAEKMAFIIRHTSGIVCAPITTVDARRLRLDPMVAHNESNHTTAFTVSIDYKPDGGTGISADERASCCRALANPNVGANDFARPGHVFPLIARDGGVLLRSGHTEAAVDLCKLSGLPPVGVISELMNDDGTVMKGEQVARFAAAHKLKHVTIADMIAYRQAREKLIERVATFITESPIAPLPQERSAEADRNRQWREVGVGAQILRDLGVTSIRHLTSSVHDYKGLSGFGIEIVSNEQLEGETSKI